MADLRLRIPPDQLAMFKRTLTIPENEFSAIARDALSLERIPTISALRGELIAKGHEQSAVDAFASVVISLAGVSVTNDSTPDETLGAIYADLVRQSPEWFDEDIWQARTDCFKRLISSGSPVHLLSKAVSVSSNGVGLVMATRIFTETRWVFSDSADTVLGALMKHALTITHIDGSGNDATASYVLDDGDLEKLKDQVDRALKKAQTIASLTDTTKTPTIHP